MHFSITPRLRTVTSGLRCSFRLGVFQSEFRDTEEIKAAHFVRAIVRTVARTDTAVVNHVVEAFAAVVGSLHGADQLARSILALHTRHRLAVDLGIFDVAVEIAVDAQPVHVAAVMYFLFADYRDVILRLAGDHARTTTCAGGNRSMAMPQAYLSYWKPG